MPTTKNSILLASLCSFLCLARADSAITMHIDSGAKTFWFSGSDSIVGLHFVDETLFNWEIGPSAIGSTSSIGIGALLATAPDPNGGIKLQAHSTGRVTLSFLTDTPRGQPTDIVGTGVAASYGSFNAAAQATMDNLSGVFTGLGFDSQIAVGPPPVPEPSVTGLVVLSLLGSVARRRR